MDKKNGLSFFSAIILMVTSIVFSILSLYSFVDLKITFLFMLSIYAIINIIKGIILFKDNNYFSFIKAIPSILIIILMIFINVYDSPWNLALLLFIWVALMSFIKLKESDFYHDRKNKLWELHIVSLIIFILAGIITTMNLYFTEDVQILVLSFFFFINSILEIMNPLVSYIISKK